MADNNTDKNQEEGKKKKKMSVWTKIQIAKITIPIVAIILAIVLVCSILYGIFDSVGDAIAGVVDGIVDFFTIDNEGVIQVDSNQVDSIINSITSLGIDIEDLKLAGDLDYSDEAVQEENEKQLRKYIKKFLEAQAMTQTINTNPGFIEEALHGGSKSYGTVYVYRTKDNDTELDKVEQMKYVTYEEMEQLKNAGNVSAIRNKYSIDPNTGELIVAGWTTTNGSSSTIFLRTLNYRDAIAQYTTPVTFLIYLTMITQNPEFVSAVVDLIQTGEIRITVTDTVTTSVETKTTTYTQNMETKKQQVPVHRTDTKTETSTTETVSHNPQFAITYVKTWFSEQEIKYKKKKGTPQTTTGTPVKIDDEPKPATPDIGTITWKTNQTVTTTTTTTVDTYEESVRGDVIDKTGEKGQVNKDTFIGLLDIEFRIPNSTREEAAGSNFRSGADWLLGLLEKDPACQRLDQVIRYILYKYTGKDYGVTDPSVFEMFNAHLNTITRDLIVDTRQSDSELIIDDIATLKKAFKGYSGNSELIKNAQAFLDMQNEYHVNALFAAAVSITETSAGRAGNAINGANNWFNIRGTNTTWAQYSSPKEGIMRFGWQIAEGGYYFTAGNYSVATIGRVYCPNTATHPDQADKWIENTLGYMVDFYEAAGIDISEFLGGDAAGVASFAQQFVGEGHSRFTSYKTSDGKQFWGDHWCAMFVSYCFDQCGAIPSVLQRSFTAVPSEWRYYKQQGRAHTKYSYTPKPGDLAIFSNGGESGIAHVGIVVDYKGSKVYTVEGNTGSTSWTNSRVKAGEYSLSSGWLYGFIEL